MTKKTLYNDETIFKFIKPNDNDKLSEMKGSDLQDLVILLNNYYIQLREQLDFIPRYDDEITFGLELEFEDATKEPIKNGLNELFPEEKGKWIYKNDPSLNDGLEINSPVLRDMPEDWINLNKVCNIVKPWASIGSRSGGHIHVGAQILGHYSLGWLNFLKFWSAYENIIYRFTYGDFLTARSSINEYAKPISKSLWHDYEQLSEMQGDLPQIIYKIAEDRYNSVNFRKVNVNYTDMFLNNNTIEFRCPNGSLDPAIWQNNVNLFVMMLLYCRCLDFDDDIVQKRHRIVSEKYEEVLELYDEIFLDQALELCDMLFKNNLDKINFLKQYLKSFEVNKNGMKYEKACELTKEGIKKVKTKTVFANISFR